MLVAILLGPILIPAIASIILIVKLKNRPGVRSNQVTARLMKFFFFWGGAFAMAWVVFVIGTTAILNSSPGPLALFLLPWAFTIGASVGVGHWYRKHYAT